MRPLHSEFELWHFREIRSSPLWGALNFTVLSGTEVESRHVIQSIFAWILWYSGEGCAKRMEIHPQTILKQRKYTHHSPDVTGWAHQAQDRIFENSAKSVTGRLRGSPPHTVTSRILVGTAWTPTSPSSKKYLKFLFFEILLQIFYLPINTSGNRI